MGWAVTEGPPAVQALGFSFSESLSPKSLAKILELEARAKYYLSHKLKMAVNSPAPRPMPAEIPTATSCQPAKLPSRGTAVLQVKPIPLLKQALETAGVTTREPRIEATAKGPKMPNTSLMQCLLTRGWILDMQNAEISPATEPIMMMMPMFSIIGATEPRTMEPVMVPVRASLNPTLPLLSRAEPRQLPSTPPRMPNKIANLAQWSPRLLPLKLQLMTPQDENTKRAQRKPVPIWDRSSDDLLYQFLGWAASNFCLVSRQVRGMPKKTANRYTQVVPKKSKKRGLKSAILFWSLKITYKQMRRLQLRFQNTWQKDTILMVWAKLILPTTAVMTVMREMEDSRVVLMIWLFTPMLLPATWVQQSETVEPEMTVLEGLKPVMKTLNQNFCNKGDS